MVSAEIKLPTWRCHKIVMADKIVAGLTDHGRIVHGPLDIHGTPVRAWVLAGGGHVIPGTMTLRGVPMVGDYYVQYDGGYESWSPAKTFEEGYSRTDHPIIPQLRGAAAMGLERVNVDPGNGERQVWQRIA